MKTCSSCGQIKSLPHFTKRSLSPDGFTAACTACVRVRKDTKREQLKQRSDEEIEAAAAARGPRKCTRCSEVKVPEEFPRDRGRTDGRAQYCKICSAQKSNLYRKVISPELHNERKKASYGRNRETFRRYRLMNRFGLTLERYREMFAQQEGLCAICRKPEVGTREGNVIELAVDHDHETGENRQLLCGNCNKGLGSFQDSVELLEAALVYLRAHKKPKLSAVQ